MDENWWKYVDYFCIGWTNCTLTYLVLFLVRVHYFFLFRILALRLVLYVLCNFGIRFTDCCSLLSFVHSCLPPATFTIWICVLRVLGMCCFCGRALRQPEAWMLIRASVRSGTLCASCLPAENARLQEDAAGAHLSDQQYNAAQLCTLDGHLADVLLWVRGLAVGHRQAGCAVYRVRCQVPREVQGSAQRRLPPE